MGVTHDEQACVRLVTNTYVFFFTAVRSLASKPTLPELLNLKTSSGSTVNIVEEIGTHYTPLGILLLNDHTGAITSALVSEHRLNVDEINLDILTRWLQGQGKQPVTWSTLIDVLRDVGLSVLARLIQDTVTSSAQPFGETVTCDILSVMVHHLLIFSVQSLRLPL